MVLEDYHYAIMPRTCTLLEEYVCNHLTASTGVIVFQADTYQRCLDAIINKVCGINSGLM